MSFLFWRVARAQTFDPRHWIAVITDMIFDYLIANLAKKPRKYNFLNFNKIFFKIQRFQNLKIVDFLCIILILRLL